MSRALRSSPDPQADLAKIRLATIHLKQARDLLVQAGAERAATKARSAIKSAEGAVRHIERIGSGT